VRELLEMDVADDDSVSDPCGKANLEVYLILAFILHFSFMSRLLKPVYLSWRNEF